MSLFTRIEKHLGTDSDAGGPVRGTFSIPRVGMIWLAANLVVTTMLTGTLFVPGVDYGTAVTMIVVGTLVGAVVLTLVGAIGTRTGLPTMALTRGSFGIRGSLVPVAANVVILMGWSWVQAMLAGVTVDYLVHSVTGFSSPILFSVICQTIVVLLAILGHEGIARVEPWLAVLMLGIVAWIFSTAFTTFGISEFVSIPRDPEIGYDPVIVLDIVIATAISWTVLSADFNRFARTTRGGVIGSGVGYTLSTVISMCLGATAFSFVLLSGGEAIPFDPGTLVEPFGAPLAIVIFLSVMATNTMVVFGLVTSVVNARPDARLRFLPTALVLGVISVGGATWFALLTAFTSFLTLIGALFAPVFAIMIVDYYLVKRAVYTHDILHAGAGRRYWYRRGVNVFAVVAWAIGAIAAYLWTYVWPLPIGATIPTLLLTTVLYGAAMLPSRTRAGEESRHLVD